MKFSLRALRGRLVASAAALAVGVTLEAADLYVGPSATGDGSGSDLSNLKAWNSNITTANGLNVFIASAGFTAGDTIYLTSGTYTSRGLIIQGSGTSTAPKRLVGLDTGSGLPLLQSTHVLTSSSVGGDSSRFIIFSSSVATSYWEIKNLRIKNAGWAVDMPASGTTTTLRTHILFENLDFETVDSAFRNIANASHVSFVSCDIYRFKRRGFTYGPYVDTITFENCVAQAKVQNSSENSATNFPTAFYGANGGQTINNIQLIDCVARNCRSDVQEDLYWNGDGFTTEEGTTNVTYTRCYSFDNHDGGFDDKAHNVTYNSCVAIGNKRGFRWHAAVPATGNSVTYNDCLSAFNARWSGDGSGSSDGFWFANDDATTVTEALTVTLNRCTVLNSNTSAVKIDKNYTSGGVIYGSGIQVLVKNSLLSALASGTSASVVVDTDAAASPRNAEIDLLPGTADESFVSTSSTGQNPQFVGLQSGYSGTALRDWAGTPFDAYDSTHYGSSKGFHSLNAKFQDTVSFQQGVNSYTGTTDTTLRANASTTNYGSDTQLIMHGNPDHVALLRFGLTSIPRYKTITDVKLTLDVTNTSPETYELYALKRSWTEGGATWLTRDGTTAWQSAGASGSDDRESTVLGSLTGATSGAKTITLNAAGLAKIQAWVSDSLSNHGFVLTDFANTDGLYVRSKETGTATVRPKLEITYH